MQRDLTASPHSLVNSGGCPMSPKKVSALPPHFLSNCNSHSNRKKPERAGSLQNRQSWLILHHLLGKGKVKTLTQVLMALRRRRGRGVLTDRAFKISRSSSSRQRRARICCCCCVCCSCTNTAILDAADDPCSFYSWPCTLGPPFLSTSQWQARCSRET